MKTLGLTGGIATGKSTVATLLRDTYGVPLIDADQVARDVVQPGSPALEEIRRTFGDEVLLPTGALNRKALGRIVMADAEKRRVLEAITHPRIGQSIEEWLSTQDTQGAAWAAVEAALMVESGSYHRYDILIVVSCSPATQIARLRAREGFDQEVAQRWLDAQLPLAEKEAVADHVLHNDDDLAQLAEAVAKLWHTLNTTG